MNKAKGKFTNQKNNLNAWCVGVDVNYFMLNIQFQLLILCIKFLGIFVKVSEIG